ncbi:hypothetical protein STEG23_000635, partial [Scotinomys teguina]
MGRYQIFQMSFLMICSAMMTPHVVLENFTAAIPGHRCWVHILDNDTVSDNDSGILSREDLLRISIPLDSNLKPDKCRRFVQPQWHLLHLNGTFSNVTEADTEPCVDGWVYDQSTFLSTTVTEVVRTTMRQELEATQTKPSLWDLFRTPNLRKRVVLLCLLRFTIAIPTFGFGIHLQHLKTNVFLMQCLIGLVSIPACVAAMFLLKHIGRRISQLLLCVLFGITILVTVFVPEDMQTLRAVLITLAGANCVVVYSGNLIHSNELLPTVIRTSSTILNKSGKSGQPCLVPDFSGIALSFSPFNLMLAVDLLSIAFIMF